MLSPRSGSSATCTSATRLEAAVTTAMPRTATETSRAAGAVERLCRSAADQSPASSYIHTLVKHITVMTYPRLLMIYSPLLSCNLEKDVQYRVASDSRCVISCAWSLGRYGGGQLQRSRAAHIGRAQQYHSSRPFCVAPKVISPHLALPIHCLSSLGASHTFQGTCLSSRYSPSRPILVRQSGICLYVAAVLVAYGQSSDRSF